MEPTHLVRRSPDWALEQVADPILYNPVGRKPDRILDPLGFQEIIDFRVSEARVGAEIDARDLAAPEVATVRRLLVAIFALQCRGQPCPVAHLSIF